MSIQEPKGYKPTQAMQDFIKEKLQLLKKDKSSRTWDTKKVRMLDKMFQSTADLIYLLESVADNPELQEVFEDDLREFFEVRPDSSTKQLSPLFGPELGGMRIQETLFSRLVFASVIPHEEDYDNFRIKLLHELMCIVFSKMWFILTKKYSRYDIVTKSALEDIQKAMGWTSFQSKNIHDYAKEPSRFMDFSAPYKASLRKKKK